MAQNQINSRILVPVWLSVVIAGTVLMTQYASTPGRSGTASRTWPKDSVIPFDSNRPTLVMFLHPRCPCSRASLGELERLVAEVSPRPSIQALLIKPEGTAPDWEKTDLWRKASTLVGVQVHTDRGGIEARRFRVETSGQVLLYGPDGKLKFQGGITLARGHEGANPGHTALRQLLRASLPAKVETPVFGCGLFAAPDCAGEAVLCKQ